MRDKSVVIFTVPVYAFNQVALDKKADKEKKKVLQRAEGLDDDTQRRLIDICTYPYRCWKFNHIVAYIEVFANLNDVYFNLYMPYKMKRYHWNSSRKTWLAYLGYDHNHFRVYDEDSNELIIEKIRVRLKETEKLFPKNWFVDYESFETYTKYLDVKTLLHDYRTEANC